MTDFKRLHITPLPPAQLRGILQPDLLPLARNISYHTIETFPEKAYGYVDLPASEAEKLKKKLHGLIFRGVKMRVEEAKPERRKRGAETDEEEEANKGGRTKREKVAKGKKADGIIDGVELSEGRKVKRGWAGAEGKKAKMDDKPKGRTSARRSSNTQEKTECLFKTKLPIGTTASEGTVSKKKSKRSRNGETVIQEFSNNTKPPSFLREEDPGSGYNVTTEFVEGKGWVAADGTVVEKASRSKRQKPQAIPDKETPNPDLKVTRPLTRSSKTLGQALKASEQGNSGSATSSTTSSDATSGAEDEANAPARLASLSITRSSPSPPPVASPTIKAPHPLESLFKRPAQKSSLSTTSSPNYSKSKPKPPPLKPSLELSTSFTFFGPDDNDTNDDPLKHLAPEDTPSSSIEALKVPQTPFTRQDFRDRSMRSAAPTPDTAAPGKSGFGKVWGSHSPSSSDDEDTDKGEDRKDNEDVEGDANQAILGSKEDVKEKPSEKRSEFEKWFWEHRGETNRHWKKMRREALKGKRHEANKRRSATTTK